MRILFITPYVPSPVRVRPYHFLRVLAEQGHLLEVIAQAQRARDREEARTLSGFRNVLATPVHLSRWRPWMNCARALLQGEPLWVSYGRVPGFENAVRRALERAVCDVLHVEHVRSLFLLPLLKEIKSSEHRPALVFDSVDCISELFRQYAAHSPGPLRRFLYRR